MRGRLAGLGVVANQLGRHAGNPGSSGVTSLSVILANEAAFVAFKPPSSGSTPTRYDVVVTGPTTPIPVRITGSTASLTSTLLTIPMPSSPTGGWIKCAIDGLQMAEYDYVNSSYDVPWGGTPTTRAAATYTVSVTATNASGTGPAVTYTGTCYATDPGTRTAAGDELAGIECTGLGSTSGFVRTNYNTNGPDGFYPGWTNGGTFIGVDFNTSCSPVGNTKFYGCRFYALPGSFGDTPQTTWPGSTDRNAAVVAQWCEIDGKGGGLSHDPYPSPTNYRQGPGVYGDKLDSASWTQGSTGWLFGFGGDGAGAHVVTVDMRYTTWRHSGHHIGTAYWGNAASWARLHGCLLDQQVFTRDYTDGSLCSHNALLHTLADPTNNRMTIRASGLEIDMGGGSGLEAEGGKNWDIWVLDHNFWAGTDSADISATANGLTNVRILHNKHRRPMLLAGSTQLGTDDSGANPRTNFTLTTTRPIAADVPNAAADVSLRVLNVPVNQRSIGTITTVEGSTTVTCTVGALTQADVGKRMIDSLGGSLGYWNVNNDSTIVTVAGNGGSCVLSKASMHSGTTTATVGWRQGTVVYDHWANDGPGGVGVFYGCNGGAGTAPTSGHVYCLAARSCGFYASPIRLSPSTAKYNCGTVAEQTWLGSYYNGASSNFITDETWADSNTLVGLA